MEREIERRGVRQTFVYPLEFACEDIVNWHPSYLYRMSVEEVCTLSKSNEDLIYEILEDNGIAEEAYSNMAKDEMTKNGFDVYDSEVYREGDKIIVICYALLPEEADDKGFVPLISIN